MKKEIMEENQRNDAIGSASTNTQGENFNMAQKDKQSGQANGTPYLEKFFMEMLKDIYWAEQLLVKTLPKLKEAATTEELKDAFEDHLYQTQKHVTRLEKIFQLKGQKAEGKKCEAMEGLTKETESIIKETEAASMTRDAALIIAAQKVEHYEIASYGGMVQLAITMGWDQVADLLEKTLAEEEDTDQLLTDIAEEFINLEAEGEGKSQVGHKAYNDQ